MFSKAGTEAKVALNPSVSTLKQDQRSGAILTYTPAFGWPVTTLTLETIIVRKISLKNIHVLKKEKRNDKIFGFSYH